MSSSRTKDSFLSFIVMALLAYFVVVPVIIGVSVGTFGSASELLARSVEIIPFGTHLYQLVFDPIVGTLGIRLTSAIGNSPTLTSDIVAAAARPSSPVRGESPRNAAPSYGDHSAQTGGTYASMRGEAGCRQAPLSFTLSPT